MGSFVTSTGVEKSHSESVRGAEGWGCVVEQEISPLRLRAPVEMCTDRGDGGHLYEDMVDTSESCMLTKEASLPQDVDLWTRRYLNERSFGVASVQ
jgi:hypothetical protein